MAGVHDKDNYYDGGIEEGCCCCYDDDNPAGAGKKPSDAVVLSNLHRAVSGCSSSSSGSSAARVGMEVSPKFSLFDIDEDGEAAAAAGVAATAPRSDPIIMDDEQERMLPLYLSSLPAPAAEDTRKDRKKKKGQLKPPPEAPVSVMHAMLPSQTTIAQRKEDTRP